MPPLVCNSCYISVDEAYSKETGLVLKFQLIPSSWFFSSQRILFNILESIDEELSQSIGKKIGSY